MFIILLTYTKPLSVVDQHFAVHQVWVKQGFDDGLLLCLRRPEAAYRRGASCPGHRPGHDRGPRGDGSFRRWRRGDRAGGRVPPVAARPAPCLPCGSRAGGCLRPAAAADTIQATQDKKALTSLPGATAYYRFLMSILPVVRPALQDRIAPHARSWLRQ